MYSFESLIREHANITALAGALMRAIDNCADADTQYAALVALKTDLADHLAREDADIYPQLMVSADQGAASAARDAVRKFETLAADWTDYVRRWTRKAIAADPRAFASDSTAILDRLSARVKVENDLLYPMALRAAHITLRECSLATVSA